MKRMLIASLLAVMCITTVTGCSLSLSNDGESLESTESEELDVQKVMENLDDGGFYVVHNNVPQKLYFGNATFDEGSGTTTTYYPDTTDRIMWYTDDWDEIPTLYEGDTLIFYSTEELTEDFSYERFEDLGYSVGICQMEETQSGRYKVSTNVDDDTVYPGHDAEDILNFPQDNVIIDTIDGKKPLRSDSVTRAGTIYGLVKDKTYKCSVYGGTELTSIDLKSDVRILASMQEKTTHDYEFLSSTVIKLNIPEWFNNGYYCMNGTGLFRYIKGSTYKETMDMNVLNIDPDENNNEYGESSETLSVFVGTNQLGRRRLTLMFANSEASAEAGYVDAAVEATIVSPDNSFITATEFNNQIIIEYDANEAGEYKVGLTNLNGRKYTYTDELVLNAADSSVDTGDETEGVEGTENATETPQDTDGQVIEGETQPAESEGV